MKTADSVGHTAFVWVILKVCISTQPWGARTPSCVVRMGQRRWGGEAGSVNTGTAPWFSQTPVLCCGLCCLLFLYSFILSFIHSFTHSLIQQMCAYLGNVSRFTLNL